MKSKFPLAWISPNIVEFTRLGHLGVDIFFILSGAVIARLALRTTPTQFAESRFIRIFPVYFLSTFLAVVITPFAFKTQEFPMSLSPTEWVTNLKHLILIIPSAWTLIHEVIFYALIYLASLISFRNRNEFKEIELFRFLIVYQIIIILSLPFNFTHLQLTNARTFGSYFILGACLSRINDYNSLIRNLIILIPSFLLVWKSLFIRVPDEYSKFGISLGILTVVSSLVLLSNFNLVSVRSRKFSKFVISFSLMTFPIYLFHEVMGMALISEIYNDGVSIQFAYFISFGVVLLFSWWSVTFYEPWFRKSFKMIKSKKRRN
jgi:peptidoglycan/LPS O-acetylase OafA/YrhL